ncbi:hypothetical protein [Acidovorax cavernicola]|uniref:Uncharacterized protein n=1 Tax=Acidovorax cavernicola TaxID=1675792 RepID=A0A9X8CZT2_9BURK|nr:hypothetical protein [Acidovorax cavernicola]RIX74445.1 hypothetical protein D3H34_27320 [Acidovorax cavernicola]
MAANNTPGAITDAQLDAGIAAWFGVTKVSPERLILRERMHAAMVAVQAKAAPGDNQGQDRPVERAFDAFLCRAWGETDLASAELVTDWEGVRRFMVREWLGEEDATDYDGEVTLDRLKKDFDTHEEEHNGRGGAYEVEFEIGGVSVERVCGFAPGAAIGSDAAHDVLAERQRQISAEGWTPEHDDGHVNDEIAAMACFYAMPPGAREWSAEDTGYGDTFGEAIIPEGWAAKEGDRRRELVKAGALILAEIERIDRSDARATSDTPAEGTAC